MKINANLINHISFSGIQSGNFLVSQSNIAALFGHEEINGPGDEQYKDLEGKGQAESQS